MRFLLACLLFGAPVGLVWFMMDEMSKIFGVPGIIELVARIFLLTLAYHFGWSACKKVCGEKSDF